ncbi:hypothetical protein HMPREF0731_3628, partial [Pseudoroseomonas cervicalis ATCC 49957]
PGSAAPARAAWLCCTGRGLHPRSPVPAWGGATGVAEDSAA